MAGRFSSSSILRPALAAHAGLSATSLLCSVFGPSQLESPTTVTSITSASSRQQRPSPSPCHHRMSEVCAALPWLDQLHAMIAGMYVTGGVGNSLCRARHHDVTMVMVRLGEEASFENPVVSYAGVGEIERAFRARLLLHFQNEVETMLECVNVETSEDSISGWGGDSAATGQHPREEEQDDGSASPSLPSSLIPSPKKSISSSPPKVEVTYRLSQQYGGFFSVHSLLVVTVQVRRGLSQKVRKIISQKAAVTLATSGFTPRAASAAVAAAMSGQYAGTASLALTRAANKIREATMRGGRCPEAVGTPPSQTSSPLVAEVVRIEERWNGVQLIRFVPFHWSRRLNGLVAGSAAFFFLSLGW